MGGSQESRHHRLYGSRLQPLTEKRTRAAPRLRVLRLLLRSTFGGRSASKGGPHGEHGEGGVFEGQESSELCARRDRGPRAGRGVHRFELSHDAPPPAASRAKLTRWSRASMSVSRPSHSAGSVRHPIRADRTGLARSRPLIRSLSAVRMGGASTVLPLMRHVWQAKRRAPRDSIARTADSHPLPAPLQGASSREPKTGCVASMGASSAHRGWTASVPRVRRVLRNHPMEAALVACPVRPPPIAHVTRRPRPTCARSRASQVRTNPWGTAPSVWGRWAERATINFHVVSARSARRSRYRVALRSRPAVSRRARRLRARAATNAAREAHARAARAYPRPGARARRARTARAACLARAASVAWGIPSTATFPRRVVRRTTARVAGISRSTAWPYSDAASPDAIRASAIRIVAGWRMGARSSRNPCVPTSSVRASSAAACRQTHRSTATRA